MPDARILALIWPRVGESARLLYTSRLLDVTIGPVELLPRNRRELWPMREVKLTSADGSLSRSALVSLDEHGHPLVQVIPAAPATPRRS